MDDGSSINAPIYTKGLLRIAMTMRTLLATAYILLGASVFAVSAQACGGMFDVRCNVTNAYQHPVPHAVNDLKALAQTIGGMRGGSAGKAGMTGENGDGTIHNDTPGGATMVLPVVQPLGQKIIDFPRSAAEPQPSGPVLKNAAPPIVPVDGCGMNCLSPRETNPADDLPERPIEAPTPG